MDINLKIVHIPGTYSLVAFGEGMRDNIVKSFHYTPNVEGEKEKTHYDMVTFAQGAAEGFNFARYALRPMYLYSQVEEIDLATKKGSTQ